LTLGILAVLFVVAPQPAQAIRVKQEVAPISPPREIGDDDQPGKEIEGNEPTSQSSYDGQRRNAESHTTRTKQWSRRVTANVLAWLEQRYNAVRTHQP
jgi:hypothetical protein